MRQSLQFNPLTTARLHLENGEPALLDLRCLARRRSFQRIRIERKAEPQLFAALLAWLEGNSVDTVAELESGRRLELWSKGLLISPDELVKMPPSASADLTDGHRIADAICPDVSNLLRSGPELLSIPGMVDEGFAENGYCDLPPVISAADLCAMNAFYDVLSDDQWLAIDKIRSKRYVIHNDPVAMRVQLALTPLVSAMTGLDLKPSYSFFSEYIEQAALQRHIDREQCEVTFSLYLKYWPQPQDEYCPWPLVVHGTQNDAAMFQQQGGGSLLLGRILPHSRPSLPPGHKARMVFFHYVRTSYEGSLD